MSFEPYFHNLGKRIVKRPKVYFWDTGLVCYLTGIRTLEMLEKGTARPIMVEKIKNLIEKEKEYQVHIEYKAGGLLLYTGAETGKYFGSVTYMPWYSFLEQYQNW